MNLCPSSDATTATLPRGARATVTIRQRAAAADAALGYRWRDQHDISAARQLAGRYRWLVAELADSYRDSGLPWQDLIAEGSVGLMRAICRFDSRSRRWLRDLRNLVGERHPAGIRQDEQDGGAPRAAVAAL
jgi:hypothetical protein